MHVRELGSGPPVLVLHPGPGLDGSVFLPGAERVADAGYRVVLADLPGSGRSPDPPEWTLRELARQVQELADDWSDWTLLGHSFGGYVALQHLVEHPGAAARLIASCTDADEEPPPGLPDPFEDLPEEIEAAFEREARVATPEECREVWADQMPFFAHDVEAARRMLDDVRFRPEAHRERDWGELHALDALAAADIPVLAVGGEHDWMCPLAERIARTAPRGELAVIPGAGHFPFAEAPDAYWDAVTGWLARTR